MRTTAYRPAVSRWRRTSRGRKAPDRALAPATVSAAADESHEALVEALHKPYGEIVLSTVDICAEEVWSPAEAVDVLGAVWSDRAGGGQQHARGVRRRVRGP